MDSELPSTREDEDLNARIERALGTRVRHTAPLAGGMIGRVVRVTLTTGETIVAKEAGDSGANFDLEAAMILHLRSTGVVPVPDVLHASSSLLLLEDMPGDHLTPEAEPDLGDTIARLHGVTCRKFGFDSDTLNGSFVLPNGWHDRWVPFFRDSRLIHAANAALAAGRLKPRDHHRIANLAGRLDELLTEPDMPALLHGDLWSANVLAVGPAVTALIDPSVVYGHPEAEIAYAVGMGGMGDAFVRAYTRHWPLDDGFWSTRRHVYLTYPAIMHIHYFGERYDPWLNSCLLAIGIE